MNATVNARHVEWTSLQGSFYCRLDRFDTTRHILGLMLMTKRCGRLAAMQATLEQIRRRCMIRRQVP